MKPCGIFRDHMLLQQGTRIPVWGWGEPGSEVTVLFRDQEVRARVRDGRWTAWLEPLAPGDPAEMRITAGDITQTLQNVTVGDVWLCAGQSNMQKWLSGCVGDEQELASATLPSIRFFESDRVYAAQPEENITGVWSECRPETATHFSAVAYAFGRAVHEATGLPVGLVDVSWGGATCEAFTRRGVLEADEDLRPTLPRRFENPWLEATVIYNGLIAPLLPFPIRGVIWYQGEGNVFRAWQYAKLFPAMLRDWRAQWKRPDLPFYFVQPAPFRYPFDPACLAELWDAQRRALELPHTGMAVTTDLGDPLDVHPADKLPVGRRLARWALAETYGCGGTPGSPLYDSADVEADRIRLRFRHTAGALLSRDGRPLTDFSIAGSDASFVPASARIEGETVVVHSPSVPRPVAVRFGWSDTASPNLVNADGLPASPFRTDDFRPISYGER